jgi:two-component system, sensor histidine kinase PdtaS
MSSSDHRDDRITAESVDTLGLARALIDASNLPLLLFDGDLCLITASRAFRATFGWGEEAHGRPLAVLGGGAWDTPQLRNLLISALADGDDVGPYETDLLKTDLELRRLVLRVQLVDHDKAPTRWIVLAIEDVTDARLAERKIMSLLMEKDELLRERAMLLLEMQHRIANSLQIIASVLQLKARVSGTPEGRLQLLDAHDRVMSVAAVQRHLELGAGEVEVGAYLAKLCESLESSMAGEGRATTIVVRAAPATVSSREVVSLGLITAELVINALKHAFPDGRDGKILVAYDLTEAGWALSVTDDGVGHPEPEPGRRVGLGVGVINSLAKQLHARVEISDTAPGSRIAIIAVREPAETGVAAALV